MAGGGGGIGIVPASGGTPGPRNGGRTGVDGGPDFGVGPVPPSTGPTPTSSGPPGKNSLPSPGSSPSSSGGMNSAVSNSSWSGSVAATGFAATGESRLPQRTRARFSPSEITASPAGIVIRFLVQYTRLFRRYDTYIAT